MAHVLHLVTWLNPGGLEYWLSGFIESTRSTDFRMSIACKASTKGILSDRLMKNGTSVECCAMLPHFITYPSRLTKLIRTLKVDLVHNHMGAMSLPAIYAARRANVPVISTFHSPQFSPQSSVAKAPVIRTIRDVYSRFSINFALKHSEMVTGVSRGVLESLQPDYASNPRFRVTYLGIPNRENSLNVKYDIRASNGWPSDAPVVLTLGRLSNEKNPKAALDVFKQVYRKQPSARLAFVGQGPLLSNLKETVRLAGLEANVAFLGYRDDAMQLLTQASVLLHPSRYEGFGLAIIEAAVAGVPAVASDVPGLREAVVHGETGYLHATDAHHAMADSILSLITNRELWTTQSIEARKFANKMFSTESCRNNILRLYKDVLGKESVLSFNVNAQSENDVHKNFHK